VSFLVRQAVLGDSAPIRDLFGRTFGRAMTAEEWSWKYPDNPGGWIAYVAELDGRIVGHYGGWPIPAVIGGVRQSIVAIGDVATERGVRQLGGRRNVFRSMAEEMFARLRSDGAAFAFGFPNPRALAAGERLLGYRSRFPVREVVYEIDPRASGPRATASEALDEGYDLLWNRVAGSLETGVVCDRLRMNWRYHARPDRYYRFVALPGSRPGPVACGALSVLGEEALVMDAVAESGAGALALVDALEAEAAALGARRLVFWEIPEGPLASIAGQSRSRPGGTVREAGFAFVTVTFDVEKTEAFARRAPVTAGIYDDR
jgi:hypothetical protein